MGNNTGGLPLPGRPGGRRLHRRRPGRPVQEGEVQSPVEIGGSSKPALHHLRPRAAGPRPETVRGGPSGDPERVQKATGVHHERGNLDHHHVHPGVPGDGGPLVPRWVEPRP